MFIGRNETVYGEKKKTLSSSKTRQTCNDLAKRKLFCSGSFEMGSWQETKLMSLQIFEFTKYFFGLERMYFPNPGKNGFSSR